MKHTITVKKVQNLLIDRKLDLRSTDDVERIYIGRYNKYYGLNKSLFANPYIIDKDGTREEVCKLYKKYLIDKLKTVYFVLLNYVMVI